VKRYFWDVWRLPTIGWLFGKLIRCLIGKLASLKGENAQPLHAEQKPQFTNVLIPKSQRPQMNPDSSQSTPIIPVLNTSITGTHRKWKFEELESKSSPAGQVWTFVHLKRPLLVSLNNNSNWGLVLIHYAFRNRQPKHQLRNFSTATKTAPQSSRTAGAHLEKTLTKWGTHSTEVLTW
jgi:hypothetical protein